MCLANSARAARSGAGWAGTEIVTTKVDGDDKYPVTAGHKLVIPKRHVAEYFDLGRPELNAVHFLLEQLKKRIQENDPAVKGFNIGINCGATAGQTVFHCHIHLIPRRDGDVEYPAGGIRHVIPGKGHYTIERESA
jgi:ATP adenylyltransferase